MTIREHIAEILNVPLYEALDWTTWAELGCDSLDVMDLQYKLEERLGVRFPQGEYHAIGDLVRTAQNSVERNPQCQEV